MDAQLRAINNPTRREILRRLASGEQSAGAVAGHFRLTRPAISLHLGVLRDAGLITVRKQAQSRLYAINPVAVDQLRARFDQFWDDALPRLKTVVESEYRKKRKRKGKKKHE